MVITPDVTRWGRAAALRLRPWERAGLVFAGILVALFGVVVEFRGAFQQTRKTDFGVYARAGHAVRTGADPYEATDNNGYHYTYPPAFAVLMVPLADAPAGADRSGELPFPIGVALWTLLNFAITGWILHRIASLLLPDAAPGGRRWWYARTVPLYACVGGVGWSVSMGQVNLIVVLCIVEMVAAMLNGKSVRGGVWLAAAIALKLIPAYLLIVPVVRRDLKALAGVAVGLMVFLGAIPLAGLGVDGTATAYTTFAHRVLLPGAFGPSHGGGLPELLRLRGGDSYSFLQTLHCNLWPNRHDIAAYAAPETRRAALALSAVVTLVTAAYVWRFGGASPFHAMLGAGLLLQMMMHVNAMSHMHYLAFGLPTVAALWLYAMSRQPGRVLPSRRDSWPVLVWGLGMTLPILPGAMMADLRHRGVMLGVSLVVWAAGLRTLARARVVAEEAETLPFEVERVELRKAA